MSVEAIAASGLEQIALPPELSTSSTQPAVGFGTLVAHGLDSLNTQLMSSQVDMQHLALGDVQNLHQTMIRLEEVRTSFQLFMQVRTKALEAYQDIMKMQV